MELLDEVIDRVYKVNMKRGGIIKDPSFNIYNSGGPVKPTQFHGVTKHTQRNV